ncbi:MAG: hypothetical protein JW955_13825 [Sedimentisphaerales bacterium]|nr:hypothetical protein [Sedimentisphaerales bacterium]
MVLVDTSVWIQHLRQGSSALARLLMDGQVVCHPFIVSALLTGAPLWTLDKQLKQVAVGLDSAYIT